MRILLIEDDEVLLNVLLQSLTSQHYVVDAVQDGQSGWEYAQSANYDLILTDVGLPILDGIKLCQRLRAEGSSIPILLITAKDASSDRIRGLDAGADDYLIKPLDLGELHARLRVLLRRGEVSPTTVLQLGDLRLDPRSCDVTYKEKPVALTPKEYTLLEIFLRNPSRVFSRGQLVEYLWTFEDPPLEESVKAHIKGLRQKLKKAGAVDWIENVYGLGYRLKEGVGDKEDKGTKGQGDKEEFFPPSPPLPTPPSQSLEQQFNQGMSKLWQQYQGLMIQRLTALQTASMAIQTKTLTPELRHDARQAAHKLAGVLGMFDREAGTVLAREIEQILLEDENLGHTDEGKKELSVRERKLVSLVSELADLLNLGEPDASSDAETSRLLLIDSDANLCRDLQQLAHSLDLTWKQITNLELAKIWLQSHSPDLVVLAVDADENQEDSLALLSELAVRTPFIPTIVLASADKLLNRVRVARLGGQGFLVRPVTAAQIWDMATQLLQRTQSQAVNILAVDDDPVFLAALRPMLEPWGIRLTKLDDPLRFWEVLRSTVPDLLILDIDMPQVSGLELCQAVRADPEWQGLPILFLTAKSDRSYIQQIFTIGADDYLNKPVVPAELLTRITNRLERSRLLRNLSTKDALTKLANQAQSSRDLELLIKSIKDEDANVPNSFYLAIFALTELPQINYQYGHTTGNNVLQRWGHLFCAAFREAEVLGYWGNGEFVVAMPIFTKQPADIDAEKLAVKHRFWEFMTTLRQQVFTAPDSSRFQVNFDFGLAEYPTDGVTLQSLYQVANQVKKNQTL
ncbi:multi-component transcriptional regulator [Tolypothrix sp. NIES-4075]|uniref:response regulator n=1 Tax=Tolypothrix sp. NIES-4075 TaxID=2005459 RepID=UPI000B5CD33F|nr:response regulator [Tolypothrix sp. NIES-4075]GAX42563.1 multi-component transcriptional regulator [Tolypothrix sp. NIES-4075]